MRNYKEETEKRVEFIRSVLAESGCRGIVFGNSGGKDCALVGILCKMACDNTLSVLLPCATAQNYGSDTDDAHRLADQFGIECRTVDLTAARNAEIAALILSRYGIEVDRAENGQVGLEKVRDREIGYYDAVLMDIQMPVMDGLEATGRIRALKGYDQRALPIIAMSANAYDEDVRDCLAVGMNAHIAKPFNPNDLVRLLQEQIRLKNDIDDIGF